MDQVSFIWIEILSRQRDVVHRHRVAGGDVRVGRAYDNDVVVDDPHVAPEHIRISRDETGALVAVDCGSLNGLYADYGKTRLERVALDGDGLIRIGETWLRIRDSSYPVPAERLVTLTRRLWPYAALFAVLIFGIEVLSTWLQETREAKLSDYLSALAAITVLTTSWITVWTVLSRVFAGVAKFESHALAALGALLAYAVYDELSDIAAFSLGWKGLVTWRFVVFTCTLGLTAFYHLVVFGSNRLRWKAVATTACVAVVLTYQIISQNEFRRTTGQPELVRRLYPPAFRLTPTESRDQFFAETAKLKASIDETRNEDPP